MMATSRTPTKSKTKKVGCVSLVYGTATSGSRGALRSHLSSPRCKTVEESTRLLVQVGNLHVTCL